MTDTRLPGFPLALLPLLRCTRDGQPLAIEEPATSVVEQGRVSCTRCGQRYPIAEGILSLLLDAPVHPESAHEMASRDESSALAAAEQRGEWTSAFSEATEVRPTLAALEPIAGTAIAELGCGAARYTRRLAPRAKAIVAIDFSRGSLRLARGRLAPGTRNVALVQADVTTLRLAPQAFDRVLSTLHSNLPTRDHRMACQRLAADALRDAGRYAFSMHYHGLRDFLLGEPAAGAYAHSGVYRYHMRKREARRETSPYFARLRLVPISIGVPGARHPLVFAIAQRLPIVRELGRLVLGVADRPRREAVHGSVSALSTRVASGLGRAGPRDHGELPRRSPER